MDSEHEYVLDCTWENMNMDISMSTTMFVSELGTRFLSRFALARFWAELFALALSRS
jgi:hypothetical protein